MNDTDKKRLEEIEGRLEAVRRAPDMRGTGVTQHDMIVIEQALLAAVRIGIMVPAAEAIRSSLSADTRSEAERTESSPTTSEDK